MAKAAKRRKNATNDAATHAENATCLITFLPFELIAEVLLHSKSPADILSLSRTCKHFHATLVQNPIATFIWKHVRTQTMPPIPEPTKLGLSEPQLANFIYGGGKCTECGRPTANMYASFSAQIRFCGNPECRQKHLKNRLNSDPIPPHASWLPWIEWTNTIGAPNEHPFVFTGNNVSMNGIPICVTYVRGQLLQAKNEYNKAKVHPTTFDEYKQRKQKYVDRLEGWMNGSLELCRWKWEFTRLQRIITANNHTQVESFAVEMGHDKEIVRDTPTIARLLREKLLDFKNVTRNDLAVLWPEVEVDIVRIENHRRNAKVELLRLQRSREVERLYRDMDHSKFDCFPSLPQFRKLPTLQIFQDSTLDVGSTPWRNEFVQTLVNNEVQEWATKTLRVFSECLGHPERPSAKTLTHPAHWISSRFVCTRCLKTGPKAARNKSLTFCEAAHHICIVSEKGNKDHWSPKNFVVDTKAAAVITRFVTAIGIDVQEATVAAVVSRDIMCLSCSGPIMMSFSAMIQHSHRHDEMEIMILADEELVKFSDYPVTPGITAQLMRADKQMKERRSSRCFGCKHCVLDPLVVEAAGKRSDGRATPSKKNSKAFNFDGLRCHLKEKHKVEEMADEDFFVFDEYLEEWGYKA